MISKIMKSVFNEKYTLRERLFRLTLIMGSVLSVYIIIENMLLADPIKVIIPMILLFTTVLLAMIFTFKYDRMEFAAIIFGFVILVYELPYMFFETGGIEGGSSVWMVLGIVYVFVMFTGKKLIIFSLLATLADIATYYYAYTHPELVKPYETLGMAYFDAGISVIMIGFTVGGIIKFQSVLFEKENALVNQQKKELEEMNDSRTVFFANMSHELRTPINSIIGFGEMIQREAEDKEIQEYATNIQTASSMLLSLINDILDISKMEIQKMELVLEKYSTKELFQSLIDLFYLRLKKKGLEFVVDIDENLPSSLYGDTKRISQVLVNLLSNAEKYTDQGRVTLSVRSTATEENGIMLEISVADTGRGIRKEDLEHLYDSFHRVELRRNIGVEGTGLGLSICKELVNLMGGTIKVDSIYTKESTFTISFPQKVVDETPIGTVGFLVHDFQNPRDYEQIFEAPDARVLIVDDNEMNAYIASKLLGMTNVQIDTVSSGMQCLELTKKKYYHVILMDYMMPEMNGVETLTAIRTQENGLCRESAVVVLTANSAIDAKKICENYGFDGYIEKPMKGIQLEREVLRQLPDEIVEYRLDEDSEKKDRSVKQISKGKKKPVFITTDCVCDLLPELEKEYDVKIMYLYIQTEYGRFADSKEINSDNLAGYLMEQNSGAYAISASMEEFEDFFAEALTKAQDVIHISMAANIGITYQNAVQAAAGFDHVHVIDSANISGGQALLVIEAAKMAREGVEVQEICEKLEHMKGHIMNRYMIPTSRMIRQRGYTDLLMAGILEMLQLHPVVKVKKSRMSIVGTQVGSIETVRKRFIHKTMRFRWKINPEMVYITHVGLDVHTQKEIQEEITRYVPFEQVILQKASVSNACNCGVGTVGIAYWEKGEWNKEQV